MASSCLGNRRFAAVGGVKGLQRRWGRSSGGDAEAALQLRVRTVTIELVFVAVSQERFGHSHS